MKKLSTNEVQLMLLELMKKVHTYLNENNLKYYLLGGSALGAVRHNGFIPWDEDIDIGMFREDYEKFIELCGDFDEEYDVVNMHNSKNCDCCITRIYFKNTIIDDKTLSATKLDKRLYFDVFPIDNVPENADERDKYEKKIKSLKNLISLIDVRNYNNGKLELFAKRIVSLFLKPFRNVILKKCNELMKLYMNEQTSFVCSLCSQYTFKRQLMPKSYYGNPTLHVFDDAEFYIPEQADKYLSALFGSDYMQVPPEDKRRKGHDIYSI